VKKEKKETKKTEHGCGLCDFKSTDKSNFNRHMKSHKLKGMKELGRARGLLRTHEVRAVKSKNADTRINSAEIVETAKKLRARATETLLVLREKDEIATKKTIIVEKKEKPDKKKITPVVVLPGAIYDDEMGLTLNMVKKIDSTVDGYTVKVENFVLDDDEEIDELHIEKDNEDIGYTVFFMQFLDMGKGRGKKWIEYDHKFIYC
jgi:hypothetical protein